MCLGVSTSGENISPLSFVHVATTYTFLLLVIVICVNPIIRNILFRPQGISADY